MVLHATHIGTQVPATFNGSLFSIHDTVVNVLIENGLLISLVGERRDMTAMAIHLPALTPESFVRSREATAAVCRNRGELLLRESASGVYRRVAILSKARLFAGKAAATSDNDVQERTLRLVDAVAKRDRGHGFASLLKTPANPFARRAAELLDNEGPAGLVGLGIGFTPSGDDFLTGLLLAMSTVGEQSGFVAGRLGKSPETLKREIARRLDRTTPGGATLLWMALRESFPCYLLRFWRSYRGAGNITVAVERAATHGETSGLDAVTGFAWALQR